MSPSYEELAALVAVRGMQLAEQAALIEALRAELAAARRAAGRDSSNSSLPPGKDRPEGAVGVSWVARGLGGTQPVAGGVPRPACRVLGCDARG